ncbi:hypothetical protein Tco_0478973 [Tanacetum coccineum]
MECRISKEEVKRAVWDCGVDKSPGPDGFSFSFYRHFWHVIEKDVFEAVDYFFMYGEIPNGCAGVLVNSVQSAFVAEDKILDGPFFLDEGSILVNGSPTETNFHFLDGLNIGSLSILKSLESIVVGFFNGQVRRVQASWVKVDENLNTGSFLVEVRTCCDIDSFTEVRVLQGRGINVADYIRLKLGNGENTRFWVDNWYEGGVIKELFPRMFALELNKNATVSSKLNASSLDNSFRRKARSGIEEYALKLFVLVSG